ncbi:alpha/beta hydrolase fold domain-containing protein [Aquimarina aquimarini]|uniref:alpha/beta hydrolase fold domain-containing protein n=1 Tax=Aquimarina aquimarini TaxID=1191734 RepID=UPI000D5591CF|nr:alpha/beta hydrolase fold domain-containing protein [Aquimarina aquimarini]
MKSITYYITLFVIRLKGIKKEFSKDPIDYIKLRREDICSPKLKGVQSKQFNILDTLLTEVKPAQTNGFLLLFCHGGAFVSGPSKHHWDSIKKIVLKTSCSVWMIDYPKAPENKIDVISKNIDAVYSKALDEFDANRIILLGDSVGGTLVTNLVQRVLIKGMSIPLGLILISPVMDSTMSNPAIDDLDKDDPMLSKKGVLSAKKMCTIANDLSDPRLSPINGSFKGFPNTLLFIAENDITKPDQERAVQLMNDNNIDVTVVVGDKMPHIWPLLPVIKEGKHAMSVVISYILQSIDREK